MIYDVLGPARSETTTQREQRNINNAMRQGRSYSGGDYNQPPVVFGADTAHGV